jgi:hypothetical protein
MDLRAQAERAVRSRRLILSLICVSSLLAPQLARAEHKIGSERIDFTAYTLQRNEVSLGVGAASYGVLNEITVGTYVLPWFAFPLVSAPVASAFLKLRDWFHGPVAASLRGAFLYLPESVLSPMLTTEPSARVGFLVIPLEVSVSARLHSHYTQSLQLNWVHMTVDGARPPDASLDLRLGGASAVTSLTLSSLSELRVTHVVALTLRGNLLLGYSDLTMEGALESMGTRVDARLGATELYDGLVANVIPGVALSWSNVNLHVGVGAGSNWLPFVGLPIRVITLVPDADLYVRF